jgi:hypothetical protein
VFAGLPTRAVVAKRALKGVIQVAVLITASGALVVHIAIDAASDTSHGENPPQVGVCVYRRSGIADYGGAVWLEGFDF